MRTLKKSLALVLALVMVLGLGVVGASADNKLDDYTDAKDIGDAYVEAVGVMTGLEIVDGMTETTIDPTATYTREQAAKIIAYMVLGKTAADSLTCTVAPFDDVAADRWSAGYISFCVEQGIIDGMTESTFEPTGTLTGFQWAKMLLSAVGFNANGEFTGDSWSLNTARVAHSVGLFTGDAAGADHIALQRQQAMLYAFNTLTVIGQVVYSEALGDYFYSYSQGSIGDRVTPEDTLGVSVFNLFSAEGIITDNEGVGGDATVLSDTYAGLAADQVAAINADTDAYMMYHAARIWFVVGGTDRNPTADSVYVNDLAKVTTLECPTETERTDLEKTVNANALTTGLWIGEGAQGAEPYEYALIDNSAADLPSTTDNFGAVAYYFHLGRLGTRSVSADVTHVDGARVENDNIWTDISDISRGEQIIYMYDGGVYYVYPVSSTSGAVTRVAIGSGNITLADGTVLEPSVLCDDYTAIVNELEDAIVDGGHNQPNYSFVLDTHGHYISMGNNAFRSVGYFTGDLRWNNDHNAWSSDYGMDALFVDVATGEIEAVPVTDDWLDANPHSGGYYDITDGLYAGEDVYTPDEITAEDNVYGQSYVVALDLAVTSSAHILSFVDGGETINAVFDADDVLYYIASNTGSRLVVDDYTGNAELIAAYREKYNNGANTVNLENVAAVVEFNGVNWTVTSIFAWDGVATVEGGIYFFPKTLTRNDYIIESGSYALATGYLNGSAEAVTVRVNPNRTYTAGFYVYEIDDSTGLYTLVPYTGSNLHLSASNVTADNDQSDFWIDGNRVSDDVLVVDTRENVAKVDTIEEVYDLMYTDYNEAPDHPVNVAYVVESNQVTVIYVVDVNYYTVQVGLAATVTNVDSISPEFKSVEAEEGATMEFTITREDTGFAETTYYVYYTYNGVEVEAPATATCTAGANEMTVEIPVSGNAVIVVTSVTSTAPTA